MPLSIVSKLLWPWAGRDLISLRFIALASVVAIALGVAAFGAIRLANQSASASFEQAILSLSGSSDLEISSSGAGMPENFWQDIQGIEGVKAATPLVDGSVSLPELSNLQLLLQGRDPFSVAPFALPGQAATQPEPNNSEQQTRPSAQADPARWFAYPARVWVDSRFAAQHQLEVGQTLLLANRLGERSKVRIGGLIESSSSAAPSNRLWCDIGWAQELLGQAGSLSQILLQAEDSSSAAKLETLQERIRSHPNFPTAASVAPPSSRSDGLRSLLAGYRLNLSALALVSLLVGCFLIYGTLAATTARRAREIAILRSVGAGASTVFLLVLGQALLLAIPGILLGLPLGAWGGKFVLEAIRAGRIDDLVAIASGQYQVHYPELFLAAAAGLGAALIGALLPAWQSLRHRPIDTLRPHRASGTKKPKLKPLIYCGAACLLAAFACAWIALGGSMPWFSFVACLCLVIGVTFLILPATRLLGQALGVLTGISSLADLARRNFLRSQSRSALTMAGLILALAMLGGVEIMIFSFRGSLEKWLETNLQADYFVRPIDHESANTDFGLPPELVEGVSYLAKQNQGQVETLIISELELSNGRRYAANLIDSPDQSRAFSLLKFEEAALERFWRGEALLASEAFARAEGVKLGETITLKTPQGELTLPLAGILLDYADDLGRLYLAQDKFLQSWPNPGLFALAVYLPEGANQAVVSSELNALAALHGAELIAQKELKETSLAMFDSTFQITYALRIIAILVAALGAFALMSIQLRERSAEIASLRSQGGYAGQIFSLHLWEGGILGVATGILGTLCGIGLAALLTWVVMKAFFGYTIEFSINPMTLIFLPAGMVIATLLAVLIPSWQSAHAPLIRALREE